MNLLSKISAETNHLRGSIEPYASSQIDHPSRRSKRMGSASYQIDSFLDLHGPDEQTINSKLRQAHLVYLTSRVHGHDRSLPETVEWIHSLRSLLSNNTQRLPRRWYSGPSNAPVLGAKPKTRMRTSRRRPCVDAASGGETPRGCTDRAEQRRQTSALRVGKVRFFSCSPWVYSRHAQARRHWLPPRPYPTNLSLFLIAAMLCDGTSFTVTDETTMMARDGALIQQ